MKAKHFAFLILLNLAAWLVVFYRQPPEPGPSPATATSTPSEPTLPNPHPETPPTKTGTTSPLGTAEGAEEPTTNENGLVEVTGMVLDEQGEPVSGAAITLSILYPEKETIEEETHRDGSVTIQTKPFLNALVYCELDGYMIALEQLMPPEREFRFILREKPGWERAPGSRRIAGKVLNTEGVPLQDVKVFCSQCVGRNYTKTNQRGHYSFSQVLPGAVLSFAKSEFIPEELDPFTQTDTDVVLRRSPIIRGRAIDRQTGRPYLRIDVHFNQGDNRIWTEHFQDLSPDGVFEFRELIPNKPGTLVFKLKDREVNTFSITPTSEMTESIQDFYLDFTRGRIHVLVLDEAGQPIRDLNCTVRLRNQFRSGTSTSDQGLAIFENVVANQSYQIEIEGQGYVPETLTNVVPEPLASELPPIVIRTKKGHKIEGFIDKELYPGYARLWITDSRGHETKLMYEQDRFEHDGLPLGETTFRLIGNDYEDTQYLDITGEGNQWVSFGEPPLFSIEGQVYLGERLGAHTSIVLYDEKGRSQVMKTDANGRFRFASMREGTYYLCLEHHQMRHYLSSGRLMPNTHQITLFDQSITDMPFYFNNWHRVTGCAKEASLLRITGTMSTGHPYVEYVQWSNKRFVFHELPPGTYDIQYATLENPENFSVLYSDITLDDRILNHDLCNNR
ncbi:carboxypeptidase-like regulatory domain-containing protein [Sulfidibacter corallicola]|uniref:Carboxypeptidase regulatory-like domain-containing protein n=1 Tax=Sulfidibacter corallicola TaxID=2818388 RepID=A0A8A4TPE7_SULCO|nr:carboxypeptidase-like regulatory domain-containing protein [Sulfidibacter corallicola]QTD51420.1 hypothetical protein J3U87_03030 [Sulfidibacter corallicola]